MSSASTIPPRIIQTARTRDLPPLARAAQKNLQLLHPDWEFLFFDDAAVLHFIVTEFPQYRSVFESFPHKIQRFDFFRYLAVYRHGGFYFDLDVFFSDRLDSLLAHRCVFPFEELTMNRFLREQHGLDFELGNYAFAATPGHPFLAAIIENCVRAQRDHAWAAPMFRGIPKLFRPGFDVLHTTGPGLVTRTFAELATATAQEVTVLYPSSRDTCDLTDSANWHRFGPHGIHVMEASWRPRRNFLVRKAALLWENRERARALAATRARPSRQALTAPTPAPRLA